MSSQATPRHGVSGARFITRAAVVVCAAMGPLLFDHSAARLFGGGAVWADTERMRLEPGERERLRGELREQPWYRGHERRGEPRSGDELTPRGPVDGPRGMGPRWRRTDDAGPPGPWPGMRLSPDERRELRRQLRERQGGEPRGRWGDMREGHESP